MNKQADLTNAMDLETSVESALQANETTGRYQITVAVQGATVSLTGVVPTQEIKTTAEQITHSVKGVIDVINELRVVPDADRHTLLGFSVQDNGGDMTRSRPDVGGPAVLAMPAGANMGSAGSTAGAFVPFAVADDETTDQVSEDSEDVRG